MPRYTKFQILLKGVSASPWTKDFRHLEPIPREWLKKQTKFDPEIKAVKAHDRVKYWNIVPGDQIRLLGDPEGTIHEVHRINKLSNEVHLRKETAVHTEDMKKAAEEAEHIVPYSQCQLLVGTYNFPPAAGSTQPTPTKVFAQRVATSEPKWNSFTHRYIWNRYAVNVVPRPPDSAQERILIPWPKQEKRSLPKAGIYDTSQEALAEVTYVPPPLPSNFMAPAPLPPSEHEYIKSLTNPSANPYDASAPMEVHLHKELSNPHSRAKKIIRWQERQEYKRTLLAKMVADELKNLKGRTQRDATAEATFKFKQQMEEERKIEMKRRFKNRGDEAKLARKRMRKARKAEQQSRKLRELVLAAAPNQVIPEAHA